MRIFFVALMFLAPLFAQQNISLKNVAKELSDPAQATKPTIMSHTRKLLEPTQGLRDYQSTPNSSLVQKLRDKKDLRIRIFGDSHIAGDFLSHRLRGLLFESNALGFVYPLYPAYHQNIMLKYENQNFEVLNSRKDDYEDYPLGGIVAKPLGLPAEIILTPKIELSKQTLTKIIFKSPNKKNTILIEDAAQKRYSINAKHAFVWQAIELKLTYPVRIEMLNEKAVLGGYFIYQPKENNFVENIGVNGARSDIWTKWDEKMLMKQMSMLESDLVILCYGSNDALYDTFNKQAFLKNYGDLIDKIRATNPKASILLLSPPTVVQKVATKKKRAQTTYKITKNFEPIKQSIHELAQQKQTLLFDMDDFMNQSGGKQKWEEANLAKRDVHLLPIGYKLIADKLYYELNKMGKGK